MTFPSLALPLFLPGPAVSQSGRKFLKASGKIHKNSLSAFFVCDKIWEKALSSFCKAHRQVSCKKKESACPFPRYFSWPCHASRTLRILEMRAPRHLGKKKSNTLSPRFATWHELRKIKIRCRQILKPKIPRQTHTAYRHLGSDGYLLVDLRPVGDVLCPVRVVQRGERLLLIDGGRRDGGHDGGLGATAQRVLEQAGQLGLPARQKENTIGM